MIDSILRYSRIGGIKSDEAIPARDAFPRLVSSLPDDTEPLLDGCLPIWLRFGRVNDLPANLKIPKYCPSLVTLLGRYVAHRLSDDFTILVQRITSLEDDSPEYLILTELLIWITEERWTQNRSITELLSLNIPLPVQMKEELKDDLPEAESLADYLRFEYDG